VGATQVAIRIEKQKQNKVVSLGNQKLGSE
jgi:hypothetical protein